MGSVDSDTPGNQPGEGGAHPTPTPQTHAASAGGGTISKSYDWDYYRHRYVTGGVTMEALANQPGAPKLNTIKIRASKEKWLEQRQKHLRAVSTKTQEAAATTEAEVSARHVKIAQALQAKALQALQQVDVSKLPASEIRQFLATATDIERKALGMDNKFTLKGVGDVSKLSDADLLALARRAGVLGDSEAGSFTA